MGEVIAVVGQPLPSGMVELGIAEYQQRAARQASAILGLVLPRAHLDWSLPSTPAVADTLPFQALGIALDAAQQNPETTPLPDHLTRESYQRSLEAYRKVGALALQGEVETPEGHAALEGLRRMWYTTLAEMLENNPDFRGLFEITDTYDYQVQGGQVMASATQAMVDMVRDGARVSEAEAIKDPRMLSQAKRDQADVYNAERVDQLVADTSAQHREAVNTRFVVSKSPRKAMQEYPEFWKAKGYREGLSFGQLYYTGSKGELFAATLSIDGVDDAIIDQVSAEYGAAVPADRDPDFSVLDGVETSFSSKEEALAFARRFRARCYELQGDTRQRLSVNEFMEVHADRLQAIFAAFCPPLAEAIQSGKKPGIIDRFVHELLHSAPKIKSEAVVQLRAIASSNHLTDDDGRLIAGLTLHAAAEELYPDARALATSGRKGLIQEKTPQLATGVWTGVTPIDIAQHMANRIRIGVEAGRTHGGGCAGNVGIGREKTGGLEGFTPVGERGEGVSGGGAQGAYGGRASDGKRTSSWTWKTGICRVNNCPSKDRGGKTKVGPCAVCRRCQNHFDKGRDPSKLYRARKRLAARKKNKPKSLIPASKPKEGRWQSPKTALVAA